MIYYGISKKRIKKKNKKITIRVFKRYKKKQTHVDSSTERTSKSSQFRTKNNCGFEFQIWNAVIFLRFFFKTVINLEAITINSLIDMQMWTFFRECMSLCTFCCYVEPIANLLAILFTWNNHYSLFTLLLVLISEKNKLYPIKRFNL